MKIQYYNNDQTDKDKDLKLVWWRQNQGTNGEDYEEVYQDALTSKQIRDGFAAWEEEIHVNLFYQRVLTDDAMSVTKKGRSLKRLQTEGDGEESEASGAIVRVVDVREFHCDMYDVCMFA